MSQDNGAIRNPQAPVYRELIAPDFEVRTQDTEDKATILAGHFARFNEWTVINSAYEGHFMERFAPGAFKKTLADRGDRIKVLFQHGRDPSIGDKVIASINQVREDDDGAYYEARLLDGIPDLLVSGLRVGAYGASFRFRPLQEHQEMSPERSDHNPDGLPERTIKEAQVMEFGPVTFPAYEGATAGIRSITDEILFGDLIADPERLRALVELFTVDKSKTVITFNEPVPYTSQQIHEAAERVNASSKTSPTEETPSTTVKDEALRETGAGQTPTPGRGSRNSRPLYGSKTRRQAWRLPDRNSRPGSPRFGTD